MNLDVAASAPATAKHVVARLHEIESWPSWMHGLREVEVTRGGRHAEVRLVFEAPRRVELRMDVDRQSDGLFCVLVEGDVTGVQSEVRVSDADGGCDVAWSLYLHFPLTVPAALLGELEREVIPRWTAALAG